MLLALALNRGIKTLSIVGMVKNAGKTVVLNNIVQDAAVREISLGLTSIGRDGENQDVVFGNRKPRIAVYPGILVATAEGALRGSTAGLKKLAQTKFSTAMGPVAVYRVTAPGHVELAGATLVEEQRQITAMLISFGAALVLIDGAFDRVCGAAVAEAIILCTGAALSSAVNDVIAKTTDRIERFSLPQVVAPWLPLCRKALAEHTAALIDQDGSVNPLVCTGVITAAQAVADALTPHTACVVLGGAAGNLLLSPLWKLAKARGGLRLVLRNGANLFADRMVWQDFIGAEGSIEVVEPIHLLAVAINPYAPLGPCFEPGDFLAAAGKRFAPLPVVDVIRKDYVNFPASIAGNGGG